jgi:hypothetical protein
MDDGSKSVHQLNKSPVPRVRFHRFADSIRRAEGLGGRLRPLKAAPIGRMPVLGQRIPEPQRCDPQGAKLPPLMRANTA